MSRIIVHVITGYSAITTYVPKQMTWADTSDLDFHAWEDGLKEVLPTCNVQLFAEATDETKKPTFYISSLLLDLPSESEGENLVHFI